MNFRTAINFPGNLGYIDHRQQILLLGSCFAKNIGLWLQQRKFNVDINPFGTLYNPLSIAQSWERIVEGKAIIENELFAFNNLWHSYDCLLYTSDAADERTVTITIPDSRGATKRPRYRS